MRRFVVVLYLHPVLDAERIAALERARRGERSGLVREWIRSGPASGPAEAADDRPDLESLGVEF